MKLDKTLNFKKVRCVKGYDDCLEIGKEYNVIDISVDIKVKDDRGELLYWESDYFESVLDSAENPLQNIELMSEFEAVSPHVSPHLTMALPMLVSLTTMCCFHVLKSVKRHIAHGLMMVNLSR